METGGLVKMCEGLWLVVWWWTWFDICTARLPNPSRISEIHFSFATIGKTIIPAPVTNQSLSLRVEVDGVGVYFEKKEKKKINLLPCVSLSQSENSQHKGLIEQGETGAIVSQRLVSPSQGLHLASQIPPPSNILLRLSGMQSEKSVRNYLTAVSPPEVGCPK